MLQKLPAKKSPTATDKHVGARARMRRKMLGMSQTALGDALGLTFQQVQKYEKGSNRIGASRLHQLSHVLQAPVSFFFEDPLKPEDETLTEQRTAASDDVTQFLTTTDGLALVTAFSKIEETELRRSIVRLVRDIADEE
jgi:transcriptional regulator with XRE-family HTH domain